MDLAVTRAQLEEQVGLYGVFETVKQCYLAAFDEGVARLSQIVIDAAASEVIWLARVHAAVSAILVFFDEHPGWARLLILQPPVASGTVCKRRHRALRTLAQALKHETQSQGAGLSAPSSELMAELIVGGALSVIRARINDGLKMPLATLAPSLTLLIAKSYQSPEQSAESTESGYPRVRTTYRTTRVLSAIGASPCMSNREIAHAAGLHDEGQTSKLLRRLEQKGVVENVGLGASCGETNAWLLTAYGERVLAATRPSLVPGAGALSGRRVRGEA